MYRERLSGNFPGCYNTDSMRWYHALKFLIFLLAPIIVFLIFKQRVISFLDISKNPLEQGAYLVTIIGGYAAALTLVAILLQIADQNRQSKRLRTYEFVSKYYDPVFLTYTRDARARLRNPKLITKEEVEANRELIVEIVTFFNYFEDACHMYNKNLIDYKIFRESMRGPIVTLYHRSEETIKVLKQTGYATERGYEQWAKAATRLK